MTWTEVYGKQPKWFKHLTGAAIVLACVGVSAPPYGTTVAFLENSWIVLMVFVIGFSTGVSTAVKEAADAKRQP